MVAPVECSHCTITTGDGGIKFDWCDHLAVRFFSCKNRIVARCSNHLEFSLLSRKLHWKEISKKEYLVRMVMEL